MEAIDINDFKRNLFDASVPITPAQFPMLAQVLLSQSRLVVATPRGFRIYHLTEVEFYLYSSTHPDEYTHRAEDQRERGRWYFHKTPQGNYRGGTFKGLDLTLGDGTSHFGVLIRAMQDRETGELIAGPCKVVHRILDDCGIETKLVQRTPNEWYAPSLIGEFVNRCGGSCATTSKPSGSARLGVQDCPLLRLELLYAKEHHDELVMRCVPLYHGPRVGLSNKYPEYQQRKYRYATRNKGLKGCTSLTLMC